MKSPNKRSQCVKIDRCCEVGKEEMVNATKSSGNLLGMRSVRLNKIVQLLYLC